ncbi:MAG TPA: hypothetical protein VKG21_10355 [Casimicrobiaceae bacterium]|nr:hypothetical protein [Casimicrobiaceae bacterium]
MSRRSAGEPALLATRRESASAEEPLIWTFDGPFVRSLYDLEDTLRRAIVQVGDVSRIAVLVELSLPRLRSRVDSGDAIQPAWGSFLARVASRYGLPAAPRVRYVRTDGPLMTMVIAYRS